MPQVQVSRLVGTLVRQKLELLEANRHRALSSALRRRRYMQLARLVIQSRSSAMPAASFTVDASGGIWLASRRSTRVTSTERSGAPGATMRALVSPKSPAVGGTSHAAVLESAVE
jgi:hypothetical protein